LTWRYPKCGKARTAVPALTASLTNISCAVRVGYVRQPPNLVQEAAMKQSDHFRENADNCQQLAEKAPDHPTYLRYKRMQDAWRSLADEQDWLDGEKIPVLLDF
jgi:hypothetical protein